MTKHSIPIDGAAASWQQLEEVVERLHEASRTVVSPAAFYEQLVLNASAALSGEGGAVWRSVDDGAIELLGEWAPGAKAPSLLPSAERSTRVRRALDGADTHDARPRDEQDQGVLERMAASRVCEHLYCPVTLAGEAVFDSGSTREASAEPFGSDERPPRHVAVIELFFLPGADALVQQGRFEFVRALASAASDFQAFALLRQLTATARVHGGALELVRALQQAPDVAGTAAILANEGRRLAGCDRLSVLQRQGRRWRLAAVSGTDAAEGRSALAHRLAALAKHAAAWGAPLEHGDATAYANEYPPAMAQLLAEHVDRTQVRHLSAATFLAPSRTAAPGLEATREVVRRREPPVMALIAETFGGASSDQTSHHSLTSRVQYLGELAAPAMAQAIELERFPLGWARRCSQRCSAFGSAIAGARGAALALAGCVAIFALAGIAVDWSVALPAQLLPVDRSDVFASADGIVEQILVDHGDVVAAGESLVVLRDAGLMLERQKTLGELSTTREKLLAVAASRTDRRQREGSGEPQLPLSAQQQQLEQRLADLDHELRLLDEQQSALTLRSPRAGRVLTRDVQRLLASRPVQRGQVLLTIADTSGAWELTAAAPQRIAGRLVEAFNQAERNGQGLEAEYRLAGEVDGSHQARVVDVSAAALIDAEGLLDDPPPIDVRLEVIGGTPSDARPGSAAEVRVSCGRRALGYVWFYDAWAALYRWWTF